MLKWNIYRGRFENVVDLKDVLQECETFPQSAINDATDAFPSRLRLVIPQNGGCIEKYRIENKTKLLLLQCLSFRALRPQLAISMFN